MTRLPPSSHRRRVFAAALLALLAVGSPKAAAQQGANPWRFDAAGPAPPPAPERFELDYTGARRYLLRDGDPQREDAPLVLAVVGNGSLSFGRGTLTARTILVWVDPDSLEQPSRGEEEAGEPPPFPPDQDPIEEIEIPFDPDRVAVPQPPEGPPPRRLRGRLRELYAEGDVRLVGPDGQSIEAERLYLDALEQRAVLVRATIRADLGRVGSLLRGEAKDRGGRRPLTVVMRAAVLRAVARGLFEAEDARVTTSPFAEPGYYVEIDHLTYEELADRIGGRIVGRGNRFVVEDRPLLEVPYLTLRTGVENPLPLIGLSGGVSSRFGLFLETRWGGVLQEAGDRLNRRLGIPGAFRGSWFFDANLYSSRGPAIGGGLEYRTDPEDGGLGYFGRTETLLLHDFSGRDQNFLGNQRDRSGFRGHFLSENRFFLPDDWILDAEVFWVSDRGFLKEFREELFEEHKTPESLVYLRKSEDDAQVSALARFRLNDWQSQTQYLPRLAYDVIARPVFRLESFAEALGMPEPVRVTWDHRSEVALVDRRLGERRLRRDARGTALRIDDVERLDVPFEWGDFGVVPFVENRFTAWAGDAEKGGGGAVRNLVTLGLDAQADYWRVWPDFRSERFNVQGLRHIVTPRLRWRLSFGSSVDPDDLVPYDRVERLGNLHVLVPGVQSRFQTKRQTARGPETVTFLEFDLQQAFVFDNDLGPKADTAGIFHAEARWRPDLEEYLLRHSLLSFAADWNWGKGTLDRFRVEFRTEPSAEFFARVAYSWSQRGRVRPTLALDGIFPSRRKKRRPLSTLTLEAGYQVTRRWEIVAREQLSFGESGGETALILRRTTADWVIETGIGTSGVGPGFGISVSPRAAFQRRERKRFRTALSDGYDLLPVFEEDLWSEGRTAGPGD